MEHINASLYIDIIATLGEGAIWNHRTKEFYWVDIEGKKAFTFNSEDKALKSISVGQRIGTIVPSSKENEVVVALQQGIYSLNLNTEALSHLEDAPFDPGVIRFNDGKCDPAGRLWVGSMALDAKPKAAALYCFDGKDPIKQVLDNLTISNGLCWSSDKEAMYFIDTPTKVVQAFDYDIRTGTITNARTVINLEEEEGSPDGMTIDQEGKLWIALFGGSSVVRCDPDSGELLQRITVPAKNVTSCTFGGAQLDTLLITTASLGMNENEQEQFPKAGAVFAAVPGVKGVNSNFFEW